MKMMYTSAENQTNKMDCDTDSSVLKYKYSLYLMHTACWRNERGGEKKYSSNLCVCGGGMREAKGKLCLICAILLCAASSGTQLSHRSRNEHMSMLRKHPKL
jgi:hypothetical protein